MKTMNLSKLLKKYDELFFFIYLFELKSLSSAVFACKLSGTSYCEIRSAVLVLVLRFFRLPFFLNLTLLTILIFREHF